VRKLDETYIYSPSDLVTHLESDYVSWMDRFALDHPGGADRDQTEDTDNILRIKGQEHERDFLARLKDSNRDVYEVPAEPDGVATTWRAMKDGREVIYQAKLQRDSFTGFADFLMRVEGRSALGSYHYEVWDTKLARSLKPYFPIQLCCYAEMLEAAQGRRADHFGIVLGTGEVVRLPTSEFYYYYRAVRRAFLEHQAKFDPKVPPPIPGLGDLRHWTSYASRLLEARDDLSLVANIRTIQIERLQAAGIDTVLGLSVSTVSEVSKISSAAFNRLRTQARLQIESRGLERPLWQAVQPDSERPRMGLALLPPASPNDVSFDMEGFPLIDEGLEYLFGATYLENGELRFRDWWAHTRADEQVASEGFIRWVHARWKSDPSIHIYHYASYETAALNKLTGRFGSCESEMDDLLRNGVFVDLLAVVRQGLIVGEPSYSLKNIEHLYKAKRSGEVATAADSIVYYHRWREAPDGVDWTTSPTLRLIRDYNEEDCVSTWQLAQWLRTAQVESKISYVPRTEAPKQPSELTTKRAELAQEILNEIPTEPGNDSEKWRVHAMLAHLLEFHRREAKPSWRKLFERSIKTEEQLVDDADCLGALERTGTAPTPLRKSLTYEYRFDPDQESKLRDGGNCRYSHDLESRITIEKIDYECGLLTFALGKIRPAPPQRLSLIPDDLVPAKVIADSIERTVKEYHDSGFLPQHLADFLFRRRPNLKSFAGGPIVPAGSTIPNACIETGLKLDGSTLCIQGPPGCGKTYTGGYMIAALLAAGKRVGITSNSHRAICLLLKATAEAADKMGIPFAGAKAGCEEDDEPIHRSIEMLPTNGDLFELEQIPSLVGGTAWVFSNEKARGKFDYLFVDEAGQVSVANLVGMAPSTRNVVLLGDQMQLNQPIQGSHPGESGTSILEYFLQDKATVPEDMGIFLPRTWRMRPEVCEFISDAIYDGRLQPETLTSNRTIRCEPGSINRVARNAGLLYVPVDHAGRTYESEEEALAIHEIVQELLKHSVQLDREPLRPMKLSDILIVAPYNLQVRKLRSVIPNANIGTVDKFQGQEAPVVILSMTTSEGDASPRGREFLFSRNRLNVAISRAQILAIIVASSRLQRTRCTRIEQMKLVNLFCRAAQTGELPETM